MYNIIVYNHNISLLITRHSKYRKKNLHKTPLAYKSSGVMYIIPSTSQCVKRLIQNVDGCKWGRGEGLINRSHDRDEDNDCRGESTHSYKIYRCHVYNTRARARVFVCMMMMMCRAAATAVCEQVRRWNNKKRIINQKK